MPGKPPRKHLGCEGPLGPKSRLTEHHTTPNEMRRLGVMRGREKGNNNMTRDQLLWLLTIVLFVIALMLIESITREGLYEQMSGRNSTVDSLQEE